ncbi:MAG: FtsX-like permease family protein [Candidatus Lokiarchaeota archaeon]|nr:FtsX-like permease family protein [Candidatus Lokiarchaeota archaeon]
MHKIFKAVIRDIWYHRWRSFITFLAIFAVITFPLAMFSTSPNISSSIDTHNDAYKLSHLDLRFTGGNDSLIPLINDSIYDTLGSYPEFIESRLLARGKTEINDDWQVTTLVGVPSSLNQSTNQIAIVEGNTILEENEVFVIESFAEAFSLTIGSNVTVRVGLGNFNVTIAGFVRSVEFLAYEMNQEGVIYLDSELLHAFLGIPSPIRNSITIYFWENITTEDISSCSPGIRDVFKSQGINLAFEWQMREISVSSVLQDALALTTKYLNAAALIIVIVVGVVIYIITKRYALEQRKQTGTLYAFGYNPPSIMRAFLLRTTLICFMAMIFGTLGGYGLLHLITNLLLGRWGLLSITPAFSPFIITLILGSSLIMTLFFTWLAARTNVRMTPYEAIRGKVKEFSGKRYDVISRWRNAIKYPIRNISRNKSRSILTFLAFAGSIMLTFSLIAAESSVYSTKDTYFDEQVKWDIKVVFKPGFNPSTYSILSNLSGITEHEQYLEEVIQSEDYIDSLAYLRGIEENSSMVRIDLQEGDFFTNSTAQEIIMSIYVAQRLELQIGDPFSFWFSGLEINTTIVGFCRDLELTVTIYMQLSALETTLGFSPYNGMLVNVDTSESPTVISALNEHQDVAYALAKDKFEERIGNLIDSQTIVVHVMVFLGFIASFLSIFATSFISALEREREYALLRVFGFTPAQVLGQLLFEIFILCIAALIIGLSAGIFLELYWNSILSSIFFTVDLYHHWINYLLSGGFAIVTVLFSILPAFRLIIRQVLAEAINEE